MQNYDKEVKNLLYNYRMYKINIINLKEELEFIKNDISVKGVSYDNQPSGTDASNSSVENEVLIRQKKIECVERKIREQIMRINNIDRTLNNLPDIEREVLMLKYVEGLQWIEIAQKVRFSIRHCKRYEEWGIRKMIIGLY